MEALKNYESVSMLIPPSDPPPPILYSALGYFLSATYLENWGCLVRCETDLVKFLVKLDKKQHKRRMAQI